MAVEPPYRIKNMMPGMIMLWYGSVVSIPSGWALCDGTQNTPDLNGKFVLGTNGVTAPGTTGGSASHFHPFTGDGHSHDLPAGDVIENNEPVGDYAHQTSTSAATGDTDSEYHWPPYHVLCWIMKLPIP